MLDTDMDHTLGEWGEQLGWSSWLWTRLYAVDPYLTRGTPMTAVQIDDLITLALRTTLTETY